MKFYFVIIILFENKEVENNVYDTTISYGFSIVTTIIPIQSKHLVFNWPRLIHSYGVQNQVSDYIAACFR